MRWGVRYPAFKQPSFALILEGSCLLTVDEMPATNARKGRVRPVPGHAGFTMKELPGGRSTLDEADSIDQQVE